MRKSAFSHISIQNCQIDKNVFKSRKFLRTLLTFKGNDFQFKFWLFEKEKWETIKN